MKPAALSLVLVMSLQAANWPSFRGPGSRGDGGAAPVPASWNVETGKNIAWKTPIPGLGLSSPIVWDGRLYLTTAVSTNPAMVFEAKLKGAEDRRQDESVQEFRLLSLDAGTGKILWNSLAATAKPRVLRHPHNSYASPTPATDGKYLVAFFGSEGLFCYDLKGRLLWKKDLGALDQGAFDLPGYQWGSASSPVLWQGKIFLQIDMHKGSFLAAFDAATGKELWRTPRDSKPSWSTPLIFESPARTELIANGVEHIIGYDAETGKELWRLKGTSMISVPTPFAAHDLIYVFSGYSRYIRRAYAIRPGAHGDITGSTEHLAWTLQEAPYLSTPIVAGDTLFTYSTGGGILSAYSARTGEKYYQRRAGSGAPASASLVTAGGLVYAANEDGDFIVFKPGKEYVEVATNSMGETVMATPAVADGTLYIRGVRNLWAVRSK